MPKLEIGDKLINLFCKPNAKGCYNLPEDYPQEWEQFKKYNARDVEAVREIWHKLQRYPMPETEWLFYRLDQHINQRGVRIDRPFVEQAILLKDKQQEKDLARFQQLTGLSSANSDARMKVWLESKGVHPQNLQESTINTIIPTVSGTVKEALQLRQELRKNSLAKYQTMLDNANGEDRLQGMFRFYGAHTGRWTSKQVQLQNLPRNRLKNLDAARGSVLRGDSPELITILYDQPADVLSQLVRTAFIPKDGCVFYVADYAAIEARVLAFFAGETWRMQAFAADEDIYCSSASQMFGVPVSRDGPNSHLRQKGKIAELALGYGGGSSALIRMGALQLGLSEKDISDSMYWSDHDKNNLICYFEENYGFYSGLNIAFNAVIPSYRYYHPVRDHITARKWGGVERREYLANPTGGTIVRDRVSVIEIWCEAFGQEMGLKLKRQEGDAIRRILEILGDEWAVHTGQNGKPSTQMRKPYGKQIVYYRVSKEEKGADEENK